MDEQDVASTGPVEQAPVEAPVTDSAAPAIEPAPVAAPPSPFFSYNWMGKDIHVMNEDDARSLALDAQRFRSGSSAWGREKPTFEAKIREYEQQMERLRPILPLLDREDVISALERASYGMPLEFGDAQEPPPAFLLPLIKEQEALREQVRSMTDMRVRGEVNSGVERFAAEHPNLTMAEQEHLATIYGEIARGNPEASTADGVYKLYNYALMIAGGSNGGGSIQNPGPARDAVVAATARAVEANKKKEMAATSIAATGGGVTSEEGPPTEPKERGDAALMKYADKIARWARTKSGG